MVVPLGSTDILPLSQNHFVLTCLPSTSSAISNMKLSTFSAIATLAASTVFAQGGIDVEGINSKLNHSIITRRPPSDTCSKVSLAKSEVSSETHQMVPALSRSQRPSSSNTSLPSRLPLSLPLSTQPSCLAHLRLPTAPLHSRPRLQSSLRLSAFPPRFAQSL